MENEPWSQISELFQSAVKLGPHERTLYLRNACGDDDALHRRVRSLLDAFDNADGAGFMDVPAVERAAHLLIEQETLQGEVIGRYRVIRRLGAGGMGEVYLANDTMLERPVAIKVMLAETAQDKERIRRFVQEAKAASALNHPNILTVYEVGDFNGSRFIATEYIHGQTLREKFGGEPLALHVVVDIAVQVAAALEAAHNAGIIHRDIKPENVMVRDDGLVKVLDFGLAKLSGSSSDAVRTIGPESETRDQIHTRAGTLMGTVAYMSPEQARGMNVDVRSDVWSLGILIFEMTTGKKPFEGNTLSDTIADILRTELAPLSDIPAELDRIITKALKKSTDERYQHATELLKDLREFKQDLEFAAKLEKNGSSSTGKQSSVDTKTKILTRTSIAVLPFINDSGNADNEYLSDGMTDSLINSLSRLPNFIVKARSSVFQYKGREVSPQVIGDELSVQAALFGRVTQLNDLLTLSLELVDTKSGDRMWGELYSRKRADLVSLQIEITRDVANKLGTQLSVGDGSGAAKADTSDAEAYQLYLQGLYYLNKRTAEDIRSCITLFERAIQKDPVFAKAYASLAMAYGILRPYSAKLTRSEVKELTLKRDAAIRRAQELDDTISDVHVVLATSYDDAWDFVAAEIEYLRAIELNPSSSSAHAFFSLHLTYRGRHEEALAEIYKAYELDPFSRSIAFNIGARLADARRFDDAIAQYRRVLEMEPDHPLTHSLLAQVLDAKGLYSDAIAEYRKADVLLEKETPKAADRKAVVLTNALNTGGAQGYWRKRLEYSQKDYDSGKGEAYRVAVCHARLGHLDRALECLERSFAARELYLHFVRTESAFDTISEDPRFVDLLRRMGLY